MKALPPLMALGGIKRPEGPTIQPRRLRRPRPRSVPTMAWTVLLIGLLAVGSGVDSQTVIQEPAMSVSPGGTVTLTCAFSSGSVTTSNYPSWFQQTPGQPPRQLIYSTNNRPTGVPSRFSGAISGNKAALTRSGAQSKDEADYYYVLWFSNCFHHDRCRWENGT
uniref:Immunoglobulin V-set domain-containing protein n=1 Tax=Sus scrofa TaxID=9823 RepID=A0A8D1T030_PIG